jgi:catechol 2,3-dioxygenase-like lactoylglutathione lyase family enzyme
MIDHVTIRVRDFEASRAFYSTVLAPLGHELGWQDEEKRLAEWGDFSIAQDGKPLSENVHVAFAAKGRAEVDAFHRAAIDAGYRDNGAPGKRPEYHGNYYGAFVLDPGGNNIEAVHHDIETAEVIDHVFLRVRDLEASRAFYEVMLEPLGSGYWASGDEPDGEQWVALGARGRSVWLVQGEPLTENVHLAFSAKSREDVDSSYGAAIRAGYRDNGPPGERPIYHEGYYGAFVLDPDGNNIEAVFHDR